jgi:hypothetical protein
MEFPDSTAPFIVVVASEGMLAFSCTGAPAIQAGQCHEFELKSGKKRGGIKSKRSAGRAGRSRFFLLWAILAKTSISLPKKVFPHFPVIGLLTSRKHRIRSQRLSPPA